MLTSKNKKMLAILALLIPMAPKISCPSGLIDALQQMFSNQHETAARAAINQLKPKHAHLLLLKKIVESLKKKVEGEGAKEVNKKNYEELAKQYKKELVDFQKEIKAKSAAFRDLEAKKVFIKLAQTELAVDLGEGKAEVKEGETKEISASNLITALCLTGLVIFGGREILGNGLAANLLSPVATPILDLAKQTKETWNALGSLFK